MKESAIIIQKYTKRFIARREYMQKKKSLLVIQNAWRTKLLERKIQNGDFSYSIGPLPEPLVQRLEYVCLRNNVIKLQRAARVYLKRRHAATVIQSYFRMWCMQQKFKMIKAALKIQAAYRGFSTRKLLKRQHAAIVIQTSLRRWLERSRFIELKSAAMKIQRNYRAKVAGRAQRQKYVKFRKTVIKLQAIARRSLARAKFKQVQYSTIKIQAYVRMWLIRKRYIKIKKSCIAMQQTFRKNYLMKCYRKEYQNKRSATIVIQKWYRAVKMHQRKVQSITKVQACLRRFLARRKYKIFQQSVIKIQIWWHAIILGRKTRLQYLQCYQSIVYAQSCVRKSIASRKYRKMKESAVTIQKYTRGFIVRRKYMQKKKSLLVIQNAWRAKLLERKIQNGDFSYSIGHLPEPLVQRLEYVRLRNSVIQFQRAARAYLKHHHAATIIQSYFRMWCLQRQFKMIKAVLKIQAAYRGFSTRKLLKREHAAIVIQSSFRKWLGRSRFIKLKSIAIQIQQNYRAKKAGRAQRQKYIKLRETIIKLQAIARRSLVRTQFKQVQFSTVKIQSYIRMWLLRKRYIKMRNSCIAIQQKFRENYLIKLYRQEYQNKRSATIAIQKWYRAVKMHQYKVHCVTKIQACFRRFLAKRNYMIFRQNVIKIQIWWHAIIRGRKVRLQYLQCYRSIVYVQSCVKKSIASRKYRKMKESAVTIQRYTRGFIARREYVQKKKSLLLIQNAWRAKLLARKIQNGDFSYTIGPLPQPLVQRLGYVRLRSSVIQFQRAARVYLKHHHAATVIQSYFRMWCVQRQFKMLKAALKIQACWRGFLVRHSITDKKIFEARKKIKAADSSEAKKLKNRTSRSLELLLIKDVLLQNMLTALQELDVCTQLSPKCCERLVESGGLTILIRLVLCCNRSIPHMELIKLTTNILLNLAKYEKTVNYVWEEEDILVTILHLMKIFREKGAAIFTKCCSLLWIFSQDPNKAQIMTEDSSVIEQIRSFHYLLTRKQSMEQKRIVAKTFISSNLFNSSVLSRTMNSSVFQRDSERSSLQIDPDWKLGKHRRREFKDPVVAITLVMKSLGIASKGGFNL